VTRPSASRHAALVAAICFTLLALLVQLGLTRTWDEAGLSAALALRSSRVTSVMLVVTLAGGGVILGPFALAFAAWLRAARGGRTAAFYIVTSLSGWVIYALLKMGIDRPRPSLIPRLNPAGWVSFPSGHAMLATVIIGLAMVLATERSRQAVSSRAILVAGTLVIAGVAVSRVYLGVHYPSDVIGGVLAGWAWIGVGLGVLRPRLVPA
jgi:undecaprenyl-diphosphatase